MGDVQDTAEVVVAALDRPGGRYLVPGETVALPHETLRTVTGRRLPAALEGARAIACDTRVDATATVEQLGVRGRPLPEAMADTVRWLAEAGHISRRQAGAACGDAGCRPRKAGAQRSIARLSQTDVTCMPTFS